MSISQKIKQSVWSALYGVFPWIEHNLLIFHEKKRQRFHIGWLHPSKSLKDLKEYLSKEGFGNHFVAWEDSDQVLSWRKHASFDMQYHLRVYNDGEIRGHYEYTPESAPIRHFFENGETARRKDFEGFLKGHLVHKKYKRNIEPDALPAHATPEIVFSEDEER